MFPHVTLRDPAGRDHELVPGEMIGRVWSAALQLDDGRVSEAHAMVSLREGELRLIPLRGALAVRGQPLPQVPLVPGLVVTLAPGVEVEVVDLALPAEVLGVEAEGMLRQMLPGVCSVVVDPTPRLVQGWREGAALHVWTTGDHWMMRRRDREAEGVQAGAVVEVEGAVVRFVGIPLRDAGHRTTRRQGHLEAPIQIGRAHF